MGAASLCYAARDCSTVGAVPLPIVLSGQKRVAGRPPLIPRELPVLQHASLLIAAGVALAAAAASLTLNPSHA
ncbi:MAG TPA: hypothetical protein VFB58_05530 [Chloroflexota bacterium]|nr:hypothetical protein [Chloroflexota bacterium]